MLKGIILLLIAVSTAMAGDSSPTIDTGTTAWMMISTTLVLLMVPGLAMFYGGLVRTKNVLGTMVQSFAAMGIIGILWVAIGYSMTFGSNVAGGWFGWNSDYVFLDGIDMVILEAGIPEYVFAMFQGKFAILTPIILAGAFAERVKFSAYCLFIALWSVIVYNPLCHWVWASDGFLFNHGAAGAIDFAGGTVVHISSGVSGLIVALLIGARRGFGKVSMLPNNMVMVLTGAGLLWVGWFGFNAGSAVSSGLDTARALTVTQVSAAAGALSWMLIEFVHQKKATALGLASGILAGLVAITPAAGSVQPMGAMFLGLLVSPVCYGAILLKNKWGYDDTLDAFGIHGVGGIFGALVLTFFVRDAWWAGAQEAATEAGLGAWGLMDQLWVQLYAVLITIGYSAVMTVIIFFAVKAIVGFRLSEADEIKGQDKTQHDESGYGFLNIDS